ncbi:unnamed protein product [Microthlaspi erraticum]|uniref:Uncharacterized protein n=1 Tax=Microthlaspi erraticum TaxID=1685480 RepID=A0A6D2IUS1_9BRAS|nr:unnamed protein product [Microthlaspi erraticum]
MVQEEKVTLKPPQEGETEDTVKEDPIPKPKQLATQARSKTKAPTPKPPKGSPRLKMRPSQEGRLENLDRIEGEKGVKTQSAPKHWPRTRKEFWPSKFHLADRYGRAGKERLLGRITLSRQNRSRARTNQEETAAIGRILYRNGPTVPVDPGNILGLGRNLSSNEFGRPNRSTATKSSAIGPKLFSAKVSPLFINSNRF